MGIQISGKQLRNLAISGRALRKSNQSLTNFYHILSSTLLFQRKVAAEREREREVPTVLALLVMRILVMLLRYNRG